MIFTLFAFILAIGVLVTVHELGHYWVARMNGVHVERFSFGFGKVLFKRRDKNGCEWAVSALPLGGYVMMRNDAPEGASAAIRATTFNAKTVGQRAAITVAGPVANLVLAVFLFGAVAYIGNTEPTAILGTPQAHTAAAKAGLQQGERIVAVDDTPIQSWAQFHWRMIDRLTAGDNVILKVEDRSKQQRTVQLTLPKVVLSPDATDPLEEAGFVLNSPKPIAKKVIDGGVAEQAGVQDNDLLVQIDALRNPTLHQFLDYVQAHPQQQAVLVVERDGVNLSIPLTIGSDIDASGQTVGRVGIQLAADFPTVLVRYGLIDSFINGVKRTSDTFALSLKMIGRMVSGDVSVKNISGPVSIADYAGKTAKFGLIPYLQFLALISVSIGLLNLLPIPMLDGGHLLYYAIEAVRGKPLSEKWQLRGRSIGVLLLGALMVLAFTNDFTRIFS